MRVVRVVSWNLFHGRADPAAGRPLVREFSAALAGWSWDVALLQEVPPWWPPLLGRACGAEHRSVLTSRNALLPLRRALASRWPDLLKSNGGGANAILVRPTVTITAHESQRLRWRPERRVVHAVRVASGSQVGWVGNVHGQKGVWDDGPGLADPLADLAASVRALESRAGDDEVPLVLGGDLNLPRDAVERALPAGWARIASSGPDHVVGRGVVGVGDSERPPRGSLSDHAALAIDVAIGGTLPA
jgi:endonuclease/exonuclease/phosphatase family metal-dependent hydrolase